MHGPGASHFICIGHANIGAAMIGKIQIIIAKRILYPIGYFDQRGSLNIAAHTHIHLRRYDGAIG